jgi:hypothetical protein
VHQPYNPLTLDYYGSVARMAYALRRSLVTLTEMLEVIGRLDRNNDFKNRLSDDDRHKWTQWLQKFQNADGEWLKKARNTTGGHLDPRRVIEAFKACHSEVANLEVVVHETKGWSCQTSIGSILTMAVSLAPFTGNRWEEQFDDAVKKMLPAYEVAWNLTNLVIYAVLPERFIVK